MYSALVVFPHSPPYLVPALRQRLKRGSTGRRAGRSVVTRRGVIGGGVAGAASGPAGRKEGGGRTGESAAATVERSDEAAAVYI